MTSPRYPLQAVLDQRRGAKEEARRGLAEAIRAQEEEERRLREREGERAALAADREERHRHLYDPEPGGLLPIPLLEKRQDAMHYLDQRIEEALRAVAALKEAVARAGARVEEHRSRLLEADKALKTIEKHYETWRADWKREQSRREQRETEEVVLARFSAEAANDERSE